MKSVYVIESSDKRVKIGISKDPKKRIRSLSTSGGFDVVNSFISSKTILARECEIASHNNFSAFRVGGEWFDIDFNEAVNFVSENLIVVSSEEHCPHEDNETKAMDWAAGVQIRLISESNSENLMSIIGMIASVDSKKASEVAKLNPAERYVACVTWLANSLMSEVQLKLEI